MASSKHDTRSAGKSIHTIALLTDFGLDDHYVGTMKGVILSINPLVRIVDIAHNIQPQRIQQAGYLLWSAYKYFPKNTIFLNIVDPGVGSKRKIVALKTKLNTFIAPDNGILDFIQNEITITQSIEVVEKDVRKYILQNDSPTFQGRDVLAPLAAHLSMGLNLTKLGIPWIPKNVHSFFHYSRSDITRPCIFHIDHFGNIITNIAANKHNQLMKDLQAISVGRNLVSRWIHFYEEAPENTPCLLIGSNGLVEISVKNSHAAHVLNASLDTVIKVYWR